MSQIAIAEQLLLAPYGVNESVIDATLGRMLGHQVDYADLYFQYTRSEGWSLEEGIVKAGSFSIDQGVGVRAVAGDKPLLPTLMTSARLLWAKPPTPCVPLVRPVAMATPVPWPCATVAACT